MLLLVAQGGTAAQHNGLSSCSVAGFDLSSAFVLCYVCSISCALAGWRVKEGAKAVQASELCW